MPIAIYLFFHPGAPTLLAMMAFERFCSLASSLHRPRPCCWIAKALMARCSGPPQNTVKHNSRSKLKRAIKCTYTTRCMHLVWHARNDRFAAPFETSTGPAWSLARPLLGGSRSPARLRTRSFPFGLWKCLVSTAALRNCVELRGIA